MLRRFWNWLRRKKLPKRMSEQQLTDLTRGMLHAASTTAAMIAQQHIRVIDQFFDAKEDGTLAAKMVRIDINEKQYIMVPLIALVSPKGIALEKMRVEMSVRITETELKEATDKIDNSEATRASFTVQMAPKHKDNHGKRRDDLTEIEMIFTAGDPPEGIMRIIDDYTNMIKPMMNGLQSTGDGKPPTTYHTLGIRGAVNGTGNGEETPFPSVVDAGPALEPETKHEESGDDKNINKDSEKPDESETDSQDNS